MELIPNIRFNTALIVAVGLPVVLVAAVFQPSETVLKIMFGACVVLIFGIGLWHSGKTAPPSPKE